MKITINYTRISMDGAHIGGSFNLQRGDNNANTQAAPEKPDTIDKLLDEMKEQRECYERTREMHDRHISELMRQNAQLINIITQTSKRTAGNG